MCRNSWGCDVFTTAFTSYNLNSLGWEVKESILWSVSWYKLTSLFILSFLVYSGLIILASWNYFQINLHAESGDKTSNAWFSRTCKGRSEAGFLSRKLQTLKYRHGHTGPSAVFEPIGERRQRNHWSMIHIPPSTRRETGEVFLSMPQWGSRVAGREEGYGWIYGKKKRWSDSNCE